MNYATVIWRSDGDDFMLTDITFIESGEDFSASQWVSTALREEARMAGYTEEETQQWETDALNSFDLIAVIKGKVDYYF
jgi:hypothetical protein